jgi:7,8-dihydropterin-6-yl-methyl-4-(beta-D-ribofuranosyl)aminobenzene 5'-phosphate synthase
MPVPFAHMENRKKIFFDSGQGTALLHNAEAMKVDLNKAELLTLSHGHYGHRGDLPDILSPPPHHIHLSCRAATFLPRYSIGSGNAKPVRMIPQAMISMNTLSEDKVHWVIKPLQITGVNRRQKKSHAYRRAAPAEC